MQYGSRRKSLFWAQHCKCLSINDKFVVFWLLTFPQKRCLVSTICHLCSCSHSRHRLFFFVERPSTAERPKFKWRPSLSLFSLLFDSPSTSSSPSFLSVDFVHLVGLKTFSIHCKTIDKMFGSTWWMKMTCILRKLKKIFPTESAFCDLTSLIWLMINRIQEWIYISLP